MAAFLEINVTSTFIELVRQVSLHLKIGFFHQPSHFRVNLLMRLLFCRSIRFLVDGTWLAGLTVQGLRIFHRKNLDLYLIDRQADPDVANDKFLDIKKIVKVDRRDMVDRQTLALVNTVK